MNPIEAFHNAHKGSGCVATGDYFLYGDGAYAENSPMGVLASPDPDPARRAKAILLFHQAKLKLATKAFDDLKAQLLDAGQCVARDGARINLATEKLEKLEALRDAVVAAREELTKAEQQVDATTPPAVLAHRNELEARRINGRNFLDKLEKITI